MPVYNESKTLNTALKRLFDVPFPCEFEVIAIDDGSEDETPDILAGFEHPRFRFVAHAKNLGKGAAVKTAVANATGDYLVMFDADLEYSPEDLPALLAPVLSGDAEVVFGTRSFGSHTAYSFWFVMGNKAVTMFANLIFNSWISDLETCYKLMPLELFKKLNITSAGFGMEAEVTAKLLKGKHRPYEVPIQYRARSREEGKKLTWMDGVKALWILTRVRLTG
ncbi:MAG: glycosyltransferase family 2 protein [Actinomycetota bacterium]|nr:glycosyltransferase family 2 protein [Actinomycetota bacterium]